MLKRNALKGTRPPELQGVVDAVGDDLFPLHALLRIMDGILAARKKSRRRATLSKITKSRLTP